jgi:hypothetical protein
VKFFLVLLVMLFQFFVVFVVKRLFFRLRFLFVEVRATRQGVRIRTRLRLFVLRFHQTR